MTLRIVNLSKRFKDKWVLRDVSFEVDKGEIFGISGASGSGKTALLSVIAGSVPPSRGEVSSERSSRVLYSPPAAARSSIWSRLIGRNPPDREKSQRDLIDRIDATEGVLLLDDPFCALDSNLREQTRIAIRSAGKRGASVVVASSNFEDVLDTCERAAVLAGTEVKQIDTPQQLYGSPHSRAVASATGRCNFFAARRLSSSKADLPEFHTIEGGHRLFARHVDRGTLGAINQNVTLGIRPEHISISFGASFPEDNLLRATITDVRFLGASTLIDLDSNGLRLQALVLRLVGLNVGDECMLGLPIDNVHIFRD